MPESISTGELFRFFVLQQQQGAMLYLGKMVNPVTGELDRNLDAARLLIDILGMIQEKTRGNLDADEDRLLGQVLTTLRLNFVEESRRPDAGGESESGTETSGGEAMGGGDTEAASGTTGAPDGKADGGNRRTGAARPVDGSQADGRDE